MGIWVLPTANSLDVIKRVRAELPEIERQLPAGMKLGIPYDSTEYIQDAHRRGARTRSIETLLIVVIVIFLFLGSFRVGPHPDRRDSDLADRRGLPDAGLRASRSTC